jgi:hypothetical protein
MTEPGGAGASVRSKAGRIMRVFDPAAISAAGKGVQAPRAYLPVPARTLPRAVSICAHPSPVRGRSIRGGKIRLAQVTRLLGRGASPPLPHRLGELGAPSAPSATQSSLLIAGPRNYPKGYSRPRVRATLPARWSLWSECTDVTWGARWMSEVRHL